jgi:dTDP-4-amino-4,6-dideoxygalactose transaminase
VLLPHLEATNKERAAIRNRYVAAAPASVRFVDGGPGAVVHLAVALSPARDGITAFLNKRGIATDIHYPVLDCDQPGWIGLPQRIGPSGLDVSRRSVQEIFTLPCFPGLSDEECERVTAALHAWGSA